MGFIAALLAGGLLFFNSQATPSRVGDAMEEALRQKYPQSQVDVEVKGKRGFNVVKGKFKSVRVRMTNVSTSGDGLLAIAAVPKVNKSGRIGQVALQLRDFDLNGVQIESADVTWNNVVYDVKSLKDNSKLELQNIESGSARVVVAEAALQKLMEKGTAEITNAKVAMRDGRLEVSGEREVPLLGVQAFTLNSRLEARNGNEIWLADAKGTLAGSPIPTPLLTPLLKNFNPIYRFELNDKWPFRATLQSVQILEGKLQIDAALTFVPATQAAPEVATKPTPRVIPQAVPLPS